MSDDLTTWQTVVTNATAFAAIASSGTNWVAAQFDGSFLWSSNAVNWVNPFPGPGNTYFTELAYVNDQFIGLGSEKLLLSSNGIHWASISAPTNTGYLQNIIFNQGHYVAGGESRSVWVSTNLVDWWNPAPDLTSFPYMGNTRVAGGNGVLVAVAGVDSSVLTSTDGLIWTLQNLFTNEYGSYINFYDVAYGAGRFVAVGNQAAAVSTDGTNWTRVPANFSGSRIVFGAGKFVVAGGDTIATSTNGFDWSVFHMENAFSAACVTYGSGWFVVSGGTYNSKQPTPYWISPNGLDWTKLTFNTLQMVGSIAFGDGTFVAKTHRGGILQSEPLVTLRLDWASPPELEISGPRHRQYQIERCDVAASTNGWSSLGVVTITNSPGWFTDWSGTNATGHFYRAVLLP